MAERERLSLKANPSFKKLTGRCSGPAEACYARTVLCWFDDDLTNSEPATRSNHARRFYRKSKSAAVLSRVTSRWDGTTVSEFYETPITSDLQTSLGNCSSFSMWNSTSSRLCLDRPRMSFLGFLVVSVIAPSRPSMARQLFR